MKIDREGLRMGIPIIDKQHEAYLDLVERFFALAEQGHVDRAKLAREVGNVIRYAMEHFDAEEFLMRSAKYPDYPEHLAKHNVFRERADTLTSDATGAASLDAHTAQLSRWLIEWFCDQVRNDDRRLADFLKQKKFAGAGTN